MGDVEIKVSFEGEGVDHALEALNLTESVAKKRTVFFAEVTVGPTESLPLNSRGLILRRRVGSGADVSLKLRGPEGCLDVNAWNERVVDWHEQAKLEGDWTGSRHLLSASLDRDLDDAGTEPETVQEMTRVLSEEQRTLVREWMIPLKSLDLHGPVAAQRWKRDVDGVDKKADVELWRVRDLRFLEVSVRVDRSVAESTQDALTAALADLGLRPDPSPTTKTEAILRSLMKRTG